MGQKWQEQRAEQQARKPETELVALQAWKLGVQNHPHPHCGNTEVPRVPEELGSLGLR